MKNFLGIIKHGVKPVGNIVRSFGKLFKPIGKIPKVVGKLLKPLSKLLSWKTLVVVAVVAAVVAVVLYFKFGLGKGGGIGDGQGDGNTQVQSNQEQASQEQNDTVEETKPTPTVSIEQNNDKNAYSGIIMCINVVENDYFYNNEPISLNDFVKKASEVEEQLIVEVKNSEASFHAYQELINRLKEEKIKYVEK